MAKEYIAPKTINRIAKWFARLGIGRSVVLTTVGRRTGDARQVAVSPIEVDGTEYLVSPYGEVGWVWNARSNGAASIRQGSYTRKVDLVEVGDGADVVRSYHEREKFPRAYMDLPENPTSEDIRSSPQVFPVFRVEDR